MKRTIYTLLAGAALIATSLASPAAGTDAATPDPEASASPAVQDTQPVMATARDNGVRVTMAWEEPLTAGEPTYLRTTVTNTRDTPIWWLWGKSGLAAQAFMPGLERRVGEPVVPLDFGDPDTLVIDLKNNLTSFGKHLRTRLALPLELDEVQGLRRPGGGDIGLPPERLRPGGTLEFVHRWDGSLEFEQDQPGDVGLPPSGPVEVTGAASYALEPDGKVRSTEVRLETSVVGGWDEQHLDPLEVVDAVMADPGSAALLADADLSRYDTGIILFDTDEGVWYVGTCGRMSTDDPVHWRLAKVDPVGGEILGLIDGLGTDSCDAGTWPGDE